VVGRTSPEPLDHILASLERGGFALRQIVTASLAQTTKKPVRGNVMEQNRVVAIPSQ
jgi:hypothetical protein